MVTQPAISVKIEGFEKWFSFLCSLQTAILLGVDLNLQHDDL